MFRICKSIGCHHKAEDPFDFCQSCQTGDLFGSEASPQTLMNRYPEQYKSLGDMADIDVYAIHHLFGVNDPSGCLQQASMKLLMSSSSTTLHQDIREARDILTRWLQLNKELS